MGVYSSAVLMYGIELKNYELYYIINDDEYDYFDKIKLSYVRPSEYVADQYIPILGLKIAEVEENSIEVLVPSDLLRHFRERFLLMIDKIYHMIVFYNQNEYESSKEELISLKDSLFKMVDTLDPKLYLLVTKL